MQDCMHHCSIKSSVLLSELALVQTQSPAVHHFDSPVGGKHSLKHWHMQHEANITSARSLQVELDNWLAV